MARVFISGSTDGLGRAAAQTLMEGGHQVVLHARSRELVGNPVVLPARAPAPATAIPDLAPRSAGVVIGDLGSGIETRKIGWHSRSLGTGRTY
jgi:NAD(P)-dependent dehydrogenase (short-subunit alcohol dehydrogenase family)